jgi:hypothetical protein
MYEPPLPHTQFQRRLAMMTDEWVEKIVLSSIWDKFQASTSSETFEQTAGRGKGVEKACNGIPSRGHANWVHETMLSKYTLDEDGKHGDDNNSVVSS